MVLSAGQIRFTVGLIGVLDRIRVTTSDVKRVYNLARPYNTSKRAKDIMDSLAKEKALASIEFICDGPAFPVE